ncbi:PPC domain-containing DNA-binding protein [Halarsenatibacter silvermanii]|uniref:Predicted DNA-binding protein with PD1-like DNA-binding motif n=1 Tax=Halarsenatibacter silvermanii TaxID=321763 RepID=A0A1G9ME27_9FIRM|nr:PPC domain-containing DNA-binding protein [Halarsenatibacter silvermanii]SDL72530.1 Predicted DNA-binding protein with PD1-like DNA-binding motif [Halarsenatibacter silvermanii]
MEYTQVERGRIYALRLEEGDELPETIEELAKMENISSALVLFLGGAEKGSQVVAGPESIEDSKIEPEVKKLPEISEAAGFGTIFPDEDDEPVLHLHAAFGHGEETITGCTRRGVPIWLTGEVIIMELLNHSASRQPDEESGFDLLNIH